MNSDSDARDRLLNEIAGTLTPPSQPLTDVPAAPAQIPDHELFRRIGRGSYGEVWLARNVMGAWRAVKVVHRAAFDHDRPYEREFAGIRRFEPISRTHPSQLNVLHVGRNDAAGHFYYVMELADATPGAAVQSSMFKVQSSPASASDGNRETPPTLNLEPETWNSYSPRTLRSDLHRGRLPCDECVRIGLALATALDHLHRHGLVHRDIKPSNIIFVNGIPKLADIGLVARAEATLSMVGTEGYVPPEGPGTPQADIFSLGKVLYEMATGRDRQDYPELPTNLIEAPVAERAQLTELNEIIVRACASDAKQRYQTAAELHADLALLQSGKSISRLRNFERRFQFLQRAGAVAASVAVIVGALYFWQSRQTRMMQGLAEAKGRLANENGRLASENRQRLLQLQSANGIQALNSGNRASAALWFAEVLNQSDGDAASERRQRFRLGTLFREMRKPVSLLTFSWEDVEAWPTSDGQKLVGTAKSPKREDGSVVSEIRVWSTDDYRSLITLGLTSSVPAVVSPSGRWAISSDKLAVRLHDVTAGIQVPERLEIDGFSGVCAFNKDESRVALTEGNGTIVRILGVPSGRLAATPLVHSNRVLSISWDPQMRWLATGTRIERSPGLPRGQARIWDARTGQPLTDWLDHEYPIQLPVVFSPDGARVAIFGFFPTGITSGQYPGSVQVLELPSGKPKFPPLVHSELVFGAAFSPSGRYLATALPREVRVWNAHTGEPALPALTHGSIYYSIEFSPDGTRLVAGGREEVRIWDVRSGKTLEFFSGPIHYKSWPHFTPDGRRLVTTTALGRVQVWDLATLEPALPEFDSGEGEPNIWTSFSPDGRSVVVAGANGRVRLWNVESGNPIGKLMTPAEPPGQPALFTTTEFRSSWSSDGNWLAVPTHGRGVRVWDLTNGTERLTPLQHSGALFAEFSRDSSRLLTGGSDGTARIWNATIGAPLETPLQHSNTVYAARFSPDGQRIATASLDSTARLWETATGAPLGPPIRFNDRVGTVNFSPDGTRLVIGGAMKTATIHDTRSGQQVTPPLRHALSVMVARFSPDGRRVLTGSEDRTARIWDASTGQPLTPQLVHEAEVVSGEFSGDGIRVVTGSSDATARVWDALTGEPISPWLKHAKPVLRASFSPDAHRLVTVTIDGAQVWDVAPSDESAEVLAATTRLSAGAQIGIGQQVERLSAESLDAAWALASSQLKLAAAASPEVEARWHRRRTALSLRLQDWFASEFHARRLVQLQPEDAEAKASLARVIAIKPSPRDPSTPPELIDLSDYYNASLAVCWHLSDPGNDLSELPRGVQMFAGTRFDVRGLVQVQGELSQAQADKWRYPSRIKGIGVHRKLTRLQFLHAVMGRQYPTGTPVGHYLVHFANGRREEIPILYNRNATDWWEHAELPQELPEAAVAWRGANAASRRDGKSIRLFKLTWNNPSPDVEVVRVDFAAEQGDPFLVALTAE